MYRIFIVTIIAFFSPFLLTAQDTLSLSRTEAEAIFLEENLLFLAEHLNISKAEARVQQARLWANPTITLDQINLWATKKQTGGQEVSPPLWKGFGKNQQFAIEIEQMIQTAGKRKKLIAIEQLGADKAQQEFQNVLRSLKIKFREQLTELQYLQKSQSILSRQLQSIRTIITAYNKQIAARNTAKSELIRLRAQELEIAQDAYDLEKKTNYAQKRLKIWMHLSPQSVLIINDQQFEQLPARPKLPNLKELIKKAREVHPDLQLAKLEVDYKNRQYKYEQAKRIPDITIKAAYDRNGSTMLNFVGFGIAMDIPFFNRNQGNIKIAEINRQQASVLEKNVQQTFENEVATAYQDYKSTYRFRMEIESSYVQTLDNMLDAHTRNFKQKNISIIQYIDFLEAYLANRKTILEAAKDLYDAGEELNYSVGTEIIQFK